MHVYHPFYLLSDLFKRIMDKGKKKRSRILVTKYERVATSARLLKDKLTNNTFIYERDISISTS